MAVLPLAGVEILENFVSHLETFQMHDADIFRSVFPDLPLLKFESHAIWGNPSLQI
jgi:hypothetical protein